MLVAIYLSIEIILNPHSHSLGIFFLIFPLAVEQRKSSRLRNQNPGECAGRIVRRPSQKISKLEAMQRVLRKRSFVKALQHLNNLFHHSARMQKEALQHMNIDGWSLSILLKPLVTLLLITREKKSMFTQSADTINTQTCSSYILPWELKLVIESGSVDFPNAHNL